MTEGTLALKVVTLKQALRVKAGGDRAWVRERLEAGDPREVALTGPRHSVQILIGKRLCRHREQIRRLAKHARHVCCRVQVAVHKFLAARLFGSVWCWLGLVWRGLVSWLI